MFVSSTRSTRRILYCSALTLAVLLFNLAQWRGFKPMAASALGALASHSTNFMLAGGPTSPLSRLLNPDGTLKPGARGSFDTSGFRMALTATGAPSFVPVVACNGWDTQFGPPNGVNAIVNALAVSGTDIYVGGYFTVAGNIPANRVAKFDTLTNTWRALVEMCALPGRSTAKVAA